ncbi:murein biosynthesis integral membrane protein MurJ [Erysipelothrix aquatica]|uniref:murein biosynthesis integral membrane protein MurJ n=1 Tax=Erysipelothrix aquatica TaxID=2683714 RepID=UPI001358F40C|nr:murein biosynthesis integral membrane protein MurJ [Erysipelothrix aquatica]
MKRITILMMLLSILSKLFGFAREITLSTTYGAGAISDSFIFAYNLQSTLFSVFVAAFVTGFIPMFTRIEREDGEERAIEFTNNVQNVMLVIAIIVSALVFIFTEQFISILVPLATPEALSYMIPFTKVAIFTVMFTCVIQILTGFLQIRKSFLFPVALAFPMNIILIGTIILSKSTSVNILPYGILFAYGTQALLIMLYARRKGFKFKFHLDLHDKHLHTMLILAIPLIIGSATSTIGGLVNQGLASGINGGISHVNYATKIGGMVEGIFGMAIVSVMYPTLSAAVANREMDKAEHEFQHSLNSLLIFIIPCALGMVLLAQPIVEFVYMRGEFSMDEVLVLAPVFKMYSLGLVSYSVYGLLARVFYSFQNTRTPMLVSIMNISIQIGLGLLLANMIGLHGITLAMAIASTIGMITLLSLAMRLFDNFNYRSFFKELGKIVVAAIIMGVIVKFGHNMFVGMMSDKIALIVTIAVAGVSYLITLLILKVDVINDLVISFKQR